jgi:hypothetical protein
MTWSVAGFVTKKDCREEDPTHRPLIKQRSINSRGSERKDIS